MAQAEEEVSQQDGAEQEGEESQYVEGAEVVSIPVYAT
jgi:hypothetical protein